MTDGTKEQPGCRLCGTALQHTFVGLGMSPLCQQCLFVQLEQDVSPQEISMVMEIASNGGGRFVVPIPEVRAL